MMQMKKLIGIKISLAKTMRYAPAKTTNEKVIIEPRTCSKKILITID